MAQNQDKKPSKFKTFMKNVFIKDFGIKIFSIVFSVLLCLLVMGLKG